MSEFTEMTRGLDAARLEGQRWVPARRRSPALAIARAAVSAALILAALALARAVYFA